MVVKERRSSEPLDDTESEGNASSRCVAQCAIMHTAALDRQNRKKTLPLQGRMQAVIERP